MRRKSPHWLACTSDSGSLRVSPRLKSVYAHAVEVLEAEGHFCASCLFDAILDLLAVDELVEVPANEVGRA
jgi:hypothetical protein